jgi:hypothetical protein
MYADTLAPNIKVTSVNLFNVLFVLVFPLKVKADFDETFMQSVPGPFTISCVL